MKSISHKYTHLVDLSSGAASPSPHLHLLQYDVWLGDGGCCVKKKTTPKKWQTVILALSGDIYIWHPFELVAELIRAATPSGYSKSLHIYEFYLEVYEWYSMMIYAPSHNRWLTYGWSATRLPDKLLELAQAMVGTWWRLQHLVTHHVAKLLVNIMDINDVCPIDHANT